MRAPAPAMNALGNVLGGHASCAQGWWRCRHRPDGGAWNGSRVERMQRCRDVSCGKVRGNYHPGFRWQFFSYAMGGNFRPSADGQSIVCQC